MGCTAGFVTEAGKAMDAAGRIDPELVFLDIVMPGMHGYDLARAFRTRYGDAIRLIAVTAYGDAPHREISREARFDATVKKPVAPDMIESILATVVAQRNR